MTVRLITAAAFAAAAFAWLVAGRWLIRCRDAHRQLERLARTPVPPPRPGMGVDAELRRVSAMWDMTALELRKADK